MLLAGSVAGLAGDAELGDLGFDVGILRIIEDRPRLAVGGVALDLSFIVILIALSLLQRVILIVL